MWITRTAAAALLVMMTGLPAMAQDIEIATLGRAPVMPPARTAAELKRNFENPANKAILAQAARKLGITRVEYENFSESVALNRASWVQMPKHLDKMTWAAGGTVHVLQGVRLTSTFYGYRVEVPRQYGSGTLVVYLPATCGNLSYVFQPEKRVASVPSFPQPHPLVAAAQNFPAPQTPLVAATGVSGTTPAVSPIAIVPAVAHHFSLLPLAAALPFLFHGGGGCSGNDCTTPSTGTVVGPPPCP
ncbi:MAG TPA: hypothetical protein VGU66_21790 [Candidatus Elarobacter sp.]|nr:hypothetical protein [Candidatus Elarobacter sp.]